MMAPETEVDLVVWTRESLPNHHPARAWLTGIWHTAAGSGWLRGDVDNTEVEQSWHDALAYCRSLALVSVRVQ